MRMSGIRRIGIVHRGCFSTSFIIDFRPLFKLFLKLEFSRCNFIEGRWGAAGSLLQLFKLKSIYIYPNYSSPD